jgi:hypothetical protein
MTLTRTLRGSIIHQGKDGDTLQIDWFDEPSVAVVFNSSGVKANDQEAATVFKLQWQTKLLSKPIEVSALAVTQYLFTSGASPQVGGQPQVKVPIKKSPVSVVVGGQFMLGKSDSGKFGLNVAGFLGLDVTLF